MAVLVTASRVPPDLRHLTSSDLGKPEVPCHPRFSAKDGKSWMTGTSPVMTAGVD